MMTSPYTRGDSFSCGASRKHIEKALTEYGATDVVVSQRGDQTAIAFKGGGRQFRIVVNPPYQDGTGPVPRDPAKGQTREVSPKVLERATRKMWHALALAIDAKLGAVAAGVATLESEFLAHVVLPGNRTVLDQLEPVVDSAYRTGQPPAFGSLLPSFAGGNLSQTLTPDGRRQGVH